MKTPQMSTAHHACPMPKPGRKYKHSIYVCDCGCGWRATYAFRSRTIDPTWDWEQIL